MVRPQCIRTGRTQRTSGSRTLELERTDSLSLPLSIQGLLPGVKDVCPYMLRKHLPSKSRVYSSSE